jgi:O-antigen ligase/polysaccharide polymerase Wzy-like membrane protein
MTVTRLEKFYAGIIGVIFALIVLHAPISVGFGVLFPDYDLIIKSWKEILMIVGIPIAAVIIKRRGLWRGLIRDPLFYVIAGYGLLHFFMIPLFDHSIAATLAGLAIDLRYVLFFSLVYVLVKALPQYRSVMIKITIVGATIVVGFATIQLVLPADILTHVGYGKDTIAPYLTVDKNQDYIRVNSTLRGPNPVGAYAGMVLALIAAAWAKRMLATRKLKIGVSAVGVCAAIALWASYSRSSLVATIIAVGIVLAATFGRRLSRKSWIIVAVIIFAVGGAFVASRDTDLVSNVILHENPDGGSSISSNEQHAESLAVGFDRMLHQPFGAGVGSTGSASLQGDAPIIIENQYLFVAHETGWIGLGLFLALFIVVFMRLWKNRRDWLSLGVFASGIGLALIGLLLPVWVDDTVSIVWWGLAAIAIAGKGNDERKKSTN